MVNIVILLAILLIVKEIIWTIKELELIDRCLPSSSSHTSRSNKILKKIIEKIKSKSKSTKITNSSVPDENKEVF